MHFYILWDANEQKNIGANFSTEFLWHFIEFFIFEEYIFEKYDILKTGLNLRLFLLWMTPFLLLIFLEDKILTSSFVHCFHHTWISGTSSWDLVLLGPSIRQGGVFDGFPRKNLLAKFAICVETYEQAGTGHRNPPSLSKMN